MKKIILIFISILLLFACKKKKVDEPTNNPPNVTLEDVSSEMAKNYSYTNDLFRGILVPYEKEYFDTLLQEFTYIADTTKGLDSIMFNNYTTSEITNFKIDTVQGFNGWYGDKSYLSGSILQKTNIYNNQKTDNISITKITKDTISVIWNNDINTKKIFYNPSNKPGIYNNKAIYYHNNLIINEPIDIESMFISVKSFETDTKNITSPEEEYRINKIVYDISTKKIEYINANYYSFFTPITIGDITDYIIFSRYKNINIITYD